jgi:hypothetical protein
MSFAYALPWWLAVLLAAAIGALTYAEYRRPLAPLTARQRGTLAACRALVLAMLVTLLFRPIVLAPPPSAGGPVVPILVDRSRSMRLKDGDGQARLARALSLLKTALLPALSKSFTAEVYGAGDRLEPAALGELRADARTSVL